MSPPELIAGRYRLEDRLGSGATAVVYRAFDTRLAREVTLKLLLEHSAADADTLARFDCEARAVAALRHPGIVTVLDRGEDGSQRYIVFEYIADGDLRQLIKRHGPLPVDRAVELAIEIGSALAYAHESGVVHRDVKSANVLLAGDQAKVADFSIAGVTESALTETGTVMGSAEYLAPEQAAGERADARSDVYSLGVVLFELLTGTVPFRGAGFFETARRHIEEPAPDVRELRPDVPTHIAGVVARALEKEPGRRYPTMDDLVADLRSAAPGQDSEVTRASFRSETSDQDSDVTLLSIRPGRTPARRHLLPIVAAALAVGVGLVLGLALTHHFPVPGLGTRNAFATDVRLSAVTAYDPPPGDGVEDNQGLAQAADGNAATYWSTSCTRARRLGTSRVASGSWWRRAARSRWRP